MDMDNVSHQRWVISVN